MFQFINDILVQFKNCFKRPDTWANFVCIIVGFLVRPDKRGVSSVVSSLRMCPKRYTSLLRFFKSKGYNLDELYAMFLAIVLGLFRLEEVDGRVVLAADHTKIAKEGKRMPGIQKWHQESQSLTKKEYIDGHCFGFVSALSAGTLRSIPLSGRMHESKVQSGGESLVVQMVKMLGDITKKIGKPTISVMDAYFYSRTAFETALTFNDKEGKPLLTIITRAKGCAVGYTAAPAASGKQGRPRIYGEKVSLKDAFTSRADDFTKTTLQLYNKKTEVQYLVLDLMQRPSRQKLRFVLTKVQDSCFILVSTDCSIAPEQIITLYARRFKIEGMFGELKNELGGFAYHFWTKALPKRKRGETAKVADTTTAAKVTDTTTAAKVTDTTTADEVTDTTTAAKVADTTTAAKVTDTTTAAKANMVKQTKAAIEVFVCLQCIVYTILTGLALTQSTSIWGRFTGWLRKVRTQNPTIMVTKQVVAQDFQASVYTLGHFPAFKEVLDVMRDEDFLYKTPKAA